MDQEKEHWTDERAAIAVTRGCSTQPGRIQILYNDGKRILVKWPAANDGRVFREHVPAEVRLHELPIEGAYSAGQSVYVCSAKVNPALTADVLHALVVKLGLDPAFIRTAKQRTSVPVESRARGRKGGWPLAAPSRSPRPKPYTKHYPTY